MGAMHLRSSLRIGLQQIVRVSTLSLVLSIAGCTTQHAASQSNLPPPGKSQTDVSPATTRPDQMDASTVDPAELVAQRAQRYSQEMAPALARSATAPPPTTAANPSVQPSLVQWGDPTASQLSLLPGYLLRPAGPEPSPAPVDATASEANAAVGQLASMKQPASVNTAAQPTARGRTQIASIAPTPGANDSTPVNASDSPAYGSANNVNSNGEAVGETSGAVDARLSKRVRDYPHDVSAQFDYQLLQFLLDQPVPNLSTISSLPDEDREMVSAVMDGLSNYRNNLRADNNMLMSRKVRPLLDMADRLRALADLTIPTLALCQEVRGFGVYTPFDGDPPHFAAGTEHPVILYCEVQNFSSQLNDSKMWQTELVQNTVLYTEGGMSVWNDKTREVNDSARNRRRDFFLVQRIDLPQTLPMGRYLLKVSIEDKQSHHVAEATQPLLIIAQ
jgi:hypothetical protein